MNENLISSAVMEVSIANLYSQLMQLRHVPKMIRLQREVRTLRTQIAARVSPSNVIPIADKPFLTVDEASAYTGLGLNKIRRISDSKNCEFVLWNGSKRMLKREKMIKYLDRSFSI